jgi:WhiB family transcriptional regulator, redox-sensing transcriptional regulator
VPITALMAGARLPEFADLYVRPAWMRDGLCREYPELVFVPSTRTIDASAVEICRRCAVRPECLRFAIDGDEVGVWGGTSEVERRSARRHGRSVAEVIARADEVIGAP